MGSIKPDQIAVTSSQMGAIEDWMFAAGLPVESLMEKVGQKVTQRLLELYPLAKFPAVGVIVGPGHNGGDSISVARELFLRGYLVQCCAPVDHFKPLTQRHITYAQTIGIPWFQSPQPEAILEHLAKIGTTVQWWIDGLLGYGLERNVTGTFAQVIDWLNAHPAPVVSLDLPSGLDSDRGIPLGTAVQANHTLCLGLWKRGLWAESSLDYSGAQELIDLDIPPLAIDSALQGKMPPQALTYSKIYPGLSLPIPPRSHKYQRGQLLIIAGSERYRGAAILAAQGARSSGVGVYFIAVPASLAEQVSSAVPDGIVIPCAETEEGGIRELPQSSIPWERMQAVVCGPGLNGESAPRVLTQLLHPGLLCPLLLDAGALTALAMLGVPSLQKHQGPTLITPHSGEFRRLFPELANNSHLSPMEQAQQSAQILDGKSIVILKGARTVISNNHETWVNLESTPALARGGSGDVLAGLVGGLVATSAKCRPEYRDQAMLDAAKAGVYWHSQAGLWAEKCYTPLGVDAWHLAQSLSPALADLVRNSPYAE